MKRIAMLVMFAMTVFAARADYMYYLYWGTFGWEDNVPVDTKASDIKAAALYAYLASEDGSEGTSTLIASYKQSDLGNSIYQDYWPGYQTETEIGAYYGADSGYKFYVNLYGDEGMTEILYNGYAYNLADYDDLRVHVVSDFSAFPEDGYWMAVEGAPEPTSGLLLLIGVSLLALRRRSLKDGLKGVAKAAAMGVALMAVGAASAVDIASDNCYSMLKVKTESNVTAVVVPFVKLDASIEQQPISVKNALDVRTLSEGDEFLIYNRNQNAYQAYEVNNEPNLVPAEVTTLEVDGQVSINVGANSEAATVDAGYGSWLIRKDASKPVILHGQLPYMAEVEIFPGANLVGSVNLRDVDLNKNSVDWDAAGVVPSGMARDEKGRFVPVEGDHFVIGTGANRKVFKFYKQGNNKGEWKHPLDTRVKAILPTGTAGWLYHVGGNTFSYGFDNTKSEDFAGTERSEDGVSDD